MTVQVRAVAVREPLLRW